MDIGVTEFLFVLYKGIALFSGRVDFSRNFLLANDSRKTYFWQIPSLFSFEHICQWINSYLCCPSKDQVFWMKQRDTHGSFPFFTSTETPLAKHEGYPACPLWLNEEKPLHVEVNFPMLPFVLINTNGCFHFSKTMFSDTAHDLIALDSLFMYLPGISPEIPEQGLCWPNWKSPWNSNNIGCLLSPIQCLFFIFSLIRLSFLYLDFSKNNRHKEIQGIWNLIWKDSNLNH